MADPLSVAGLAAGLVSLSLQLTSGITNYLDAVKCRAEELASARGHNESLRQTIVVLQSTLRNTQPLHPASTQIVVDALKPCETELKSLEDLVARLAGCGTGTNTWKSKLLEKSRKLRYAFDRSKIQQLASRLSQANTTLSVALQMLGVDVHQSSFDKLSGIETVSRNISTDLLATRSEIASLHRPLSQMGDRFSTLEHDIGQLNNTVTTGNQTMTAQLLESTQYTQTLVSVSSSRQQTALEQLVAQNNNIMQALGKIAQRPNFAGAIEMRELQTETRSSHRLIEEPPGTKGRYDGFHGTSSASPNRWMTRRNPISELQANEPSTVFTCICNTKHVSGFRSAIRTGAFIWQSERTSHKHWPSCPLAQVAGDEYQRTLGVRYTGLARLLKSAIDISLNFSHGVGGPCLSPTIRFRPTVDENSDPVFRILGLVSSAIFSLTWEGLPKASLEAFLFESQERILQLFKEAKSTPFATDSENNTIAHKLAGITIGYHSRNRVTNKALSRFLENMVSALVPTNTYNLHGTTPLGTLCSESCPESSEYKRVLLLADNESLPIWIGHQGETLVETVEGTILLFDEVPGISESYGFGPLSNAILSKNLAEVSRLVACFPDMLRERNLVGQTPLHLAVGEPECLSLLVKAAAGSSEILDSVDRAGLTPLETAMMSSKYVCRNRFQSRKCSRCRCAQGVCILLNAECAVFNPRGWVFDRASNRALRRFARHMARRRSRLKELALGYSSIFEKECCSIAGDRHPDYQACQLVEILEKHDINIPDSLKLHAGTKRSTSACKYYNSVYTELKEAWLADLFWSLGFRDLNSTSPDRKKPPLSDDQSLMDRKNLGYLYWLLEHGADPIMRVSPNQGTGQEKEISLHLPIHMKHRSWAHHVFHEKGAVFGTMLKYGADLDLEDFEEMKTMNTRFFHLDLADDCSCKCLLDGCTLQINQLKGITDFDTKRKHRTCPVFLSGRMGWYYERFSMTIPYDRHRDTIRYLTFTALGATHTCCHPRRRMSNRQRDSEDIASVQEEESNLLEILERLVAEFDREFYDILDAQPDNPEKHAEFWGVYWRPRMKEILAELDTTNLPEEVKRSTEEIGVVWHGPMRLPDPEPTADRGSWDYWFGELDKIVSRK